MWKKVLFILIPIILGLALVSLFYGIKVGYLSLLPSIAGDCRTFVEKALPSSDGEYVAVMTKFGCGATTRDSYTVTILKRGEDISALRGPTPNGIVFSVEDYYDGNFRWLGPRVLEITYVSDKYTHLKDKEVYTVKIKYKKRRG